MNFTNPDTSDDILDHELHTTIQANKELFTQFNSKTIAITGATGFIGTFLVRLLLIATRDYGIDVSLVLVVRDTIRARSRYGSYFDQDHIRFIENDVTEQLSFGSSVDYVIHCASKANPDAYMADPVGTITTNVIGTYNVLNAAKNADAAKVLYLSTVEAYGQHGQAGAVTEDVVGTINPMHTRNCYPLSKSCTENLCISFAGQYSLPITIARLAYIYGPGDNFDDPKVVTSFLKSIKNGDDIVLKSLGKQIRTYCYIADAALGILLALVYGENAQIYNVSSLKSQVTIYSLAKQIIDIFASDTQQIRFENPSTAEQNKFSLIQNNILDNAKITALGYKENTDMENGLRKTGQYFGMAPRSIKASSNLSSSQFGV